MRLWHEKLLPMLPRQQLLGQHRECCALRGAGWGKPHATVNYVFDHPKEYLYCYHRKVMCEMEKRGYFPNILWYSEHYRGKNTPIDCSISTAVVNDLLRSNSVIYPEYEDNYLAECINNLATKGIYIEYNENPLPLEEFEDD